MQDNFVRSFFAHDCLPLIQQRMENSACLSVTQTRDKSCFLFKRVALVSKRMHTGADNCVR